MSSTEGPFAGESETRFAQAILRDSGETILRASIARQLTPAHRLEAGLEGAVNTLAQQLALSFDSGTGPEPIIVPNSNLRVRERRGEAYWVHSWRPTDSWNVETRLTGELSALDVSGDAGRSVTLAYLKPSFQVTRRLGGQDQLRLRLFRDVSQLDFVDFVSRTSFSDDIVEGGNPELRPETSWRLEMTADLRFGAQGAFTLTAGRAWISDTIDRVSLDLPDGRIDAPGNIGDARIDSVQGTLRLPLQSIIQGATLSVEGSWRRARVTDPLTGRNRTISDFEPWRLRTEFRHDLPARRLSWGLTYVGKPERTIYRFDEIDRRRESPSLDAWIETSALAGLTVRWTLVSLLGTPERRERIFFAPDRSGTVDTIERIERAPGRWLLVTASGSF